MGNEMAAWSSMSNHVIWCDMGIDGIHIPDHIAQHISQISSANFSSYINIWLNLLKFKETSFRVVMSTFEILLDIVLCLYLVCRWCDLAVINPEILGVPLSSDVIALKLLAPVISDI